MSKARAVRLSDELSEWLDEYAKERDVDPSTLLRTAVETFRDDCARGVPELREQARRQSSVRAAALDALQGVGDCPDRPGELGHIWKPPSEDSRRRCRFCSTPGRGNALKGEDGFFADATADRTLLFSRLKAPMSARGKKAAEK